MTARKLGPATELQACRDYESGKPIFDLAEQHGCSRATIRRALKRNGVKLRNARRSQNMPTKKQANKNRDDFHENPQNTIRLLKYAAVKKFGCDQEQAYDAALYGILSGLEKGIYNFLYMHTCMRYFIIREIWRRPKKYISLSEFSDDIYEGALYTNSHFADQNTVMEVHDAVRAIEQLTSTYREPLILAALGYTVDEIADELSCSKTNVYGRLSHGRRQIRELLQEPCGKRGHAKHVGVRKEANRFIAYATIAGKYTHIATCKTADEAAAARQVYLKQPQTAQV